MKSKLLSLRLIAFLIIVVAGLSFTPRAPWGNEFEISKNIEIFINLYKTLNTNYVDDLDPSRLMRTGIDAMMNSLDPYTNYITEAQIESYRMLTEGRYNGFGAHIDLVRDYVTMIEVYENSPAANAGLKAGDQIIAIEGRSTKGKTPEDINTIVAGVSGTELSVTLSRPMKGGKDKEFTVSLAREEVKIPNVPYYGMVSEHIGYIALTTFTQEAGKNVAKALSDLKEDYDLKGVIFDLRSNGGGLLHEAVNVCNVFIPKGEVVVTTKGKVRDWDRAFKTLNPPVDLEIPLVVLINDKSASASEIVSGVIQDYDRGVLLGQRSYGKGLVQNTIDIGYNSRLKMTTSKYYIPSGRCIQSVEYKEGEPVDISDDRRARFTTRAGRVVLDGGGVAPDVAAGAAEQAPLVKALESQFLIFDYVTEYVLDIDTIADLKAFHFTNWDGFKAYLAERNFQYQTETDKLLEKAIEQAKKDGYEKDFTAAALQKQLAEAKKLELERNKAVLIDRIEKDVASRYYFQNGKIQIGLRNDQEIKDAIGLLDDPAKYQKLLKK
ncbi:MAG: S41 family peptidase [Saprospirales bacterium]|nr:S41 family peptidase [Saprospirales bacterium]MBK7337375.1 S41 family peptidase [Saprospirales bacterium]